MIGNDRNIPRRQRLAAPRHPDPDIVPQGPLDLETGLIQRGERGPGAVEQQIRHRGPPARIAAGDIDREPCTDGYRDRLMVLLQKYRRQTGVGGRRDPGLDLHFTRCGDRR